MALGITEGKGGRLQGLGGEKEKAEENESRAAGKFAAAPTKI